MYGQKLIDRFIRDKSHIPKMEKLFNQISIEVTIEMEQEVYHIENRFRYRIQSNIIEGRNKPTMI